MPAPWIKRRRRLAAAAATAEVKVAPVVKKKTTTTAKTVEPHKVAPKVTKKAPEAPKRRIRKTTSKTEE